MKIAIKLDSNRNIIGINNTNENAAIIQAQKEGWMLIESNPAFLVNESYKWTVRDSDNTLVHVTSKLTPEEESQKSSTEMTDMLLAYGSDIDEIKQSITALTSMQLGGN